MPTPSMKEYDFIAKLAYFTKITGESSYKLDGAEALKKNLERHENYVYKNHSKYEYIILANSQSGQPIGYFSAT